MIRANFLWHVIHSLLKRVDVLHIVLRTSCNLSQIFCDNTFHLNITLIRISQISTHHGMICIDLLRFLFAVVEFRWGIFHDLSKLDMANKETMLSPFSKRTLYLKGLCLLETSKLGFRGHLAFAQSPSWHALTFPHPGWDSLRSWGLCWTKFSPLSLPPVPYLHRDFRDVAYQKIQRRGLTREYLSQSRL